MMGLRTLCRQMVNNWLTFLEMEILRLLRKEYAPNDGIANNVRCDFEDHWSVYSSDLTLCILHKQQLTSF